MAAEGITPFQQAVAWAMTSPFGVGAAKIHTGGEPGPADTAYMGVFRREAVEQVGGYNEKFEIAEDWELNHRIRQAGGLIWFQPALRVTYRPRTTVRALGIQYFRYGRWRRVVARQHAGTINLRYLAPPVAVAAVGAGTLAGLAGVSAWPRASAGSGRRCSRSASPRRWVMPRRCAVGGPRIAGGRPGCGRAAAAGPGDHAHVLGSGFLTSPRSLVPALRELPPGS